MRCRDGHSEGDHVFLFLKSIMTLEKQHITAQKMEIKKRGRDNDKEQGRDS